MCHNVLSDRYPYGVGIKSAYDPQLKSLFLLRKKTGYRYIKNVHKIYDEDCRKCISDKVTGIASHPEKAIKRRTCRRPYYKHIVCIKNYIEKKYRGDDNKQEKNALISLPDTGYDPPVSNEI